MEQDRSRRRRARSFVLGSLVGAAGTIATVRRLRHPSRRPRDAQAGLAAFEDAPCFLEGVEREAQLYREGAEMLGDRNEQSWCMKGAPAGIVSSAGLPDASSRTREPARC